MGEKQSFSSALAQDSGDDETASKPASASGAPLDEMTVLGADHESEGASAGEKAPFSVPTLSPFNAGANFMKSMVGSGILALPWALKQFGLVAGLLGLALLALVNVVAIRLLIACRVRLHERESERPGPEDVGTAVLVRGGADQGGLAHNPYAMVASRVIGPRFALACTTALVAAQLGVVTAYMDVITATALVLLPSLPRVLVLAVLWLALSCAGLLRGLSGVSWAAVAGLCCYLFVVAALFRFGLPRLQQPRPLPLVLFEPLGFGWWYGIAMFAFEGIGTALPVLEEMRTLHAPQRFHSIVDRSYAAAFAFYAAIGGVGYAAYGAETEDIILFNFPDSLLAMLTARSMALMMLCSAVLQIYPVHRVADGLSARLSRSAGQSTLERFALRALVTLVPAAVACAVPDVSTVVDLVGASCFSFLGIVAPAAMYARLFESELQLRPGRRALLWLLGAFGVLGGIVGTSAPFLGQRR